MVEQSGSSWGRYIYEVVDIIGLLAFSFFFFALFPAFWGTLTPRYKAVPALQSRRRFRDGALRILGIQTRR